MTTGATVMMVITVLVVTSITGYFFWKVLTTPRKSDREEGGPGP
jgi:hypothetical protein